MPKAAKFAMNLEPDLRVEFMIAAGSNTQPASLLARG